jgi:hypothetical protein
VNHESVAISFSNKQISHTTTQPIKVNISNSRYTQGVFFMSVGTCFNFPVGFTMDRQNHQPSAVGGGFYSAQESPSSILWDLDSSSLIVPPLVPAYFHPSAEFRPHQTSGVDTMRREISEESGYQTAFDEGSSSWASDWPTNEDQTTEFQQHQGWSSTEDFLAQDSQLTSDEMSWFQQQQQPNWGFPDVFTAATPTTNAIQSENYINNPNHPMPSMAGRSESTSSEETLNDVSVPSGKPAAT